MISLVEDVGTLNVADVNAWFGCFGEYPPVACSNHLRDALGVAARLDLRQKVIKQIRRERFEDPERRMRRRRK